MNSMTGEQSICFEKPPYLFASASVAGKKEGEGPLGEKIDLICEDPMLGEENWEKAESMLQIKAIQLALEKAGKMPQDSLYFCRRFVRAAHCHIVWCRRAGNSAVWTVWSLFYLWRDPVTGGNDGKCRVCRSGTCRDFQPLWKCGKAVSISTRIRESKTSFCYLDRHRKRSFSALSTEKPCKNHRNHNRESSGLRCEGFSEYGSLHGTGSGRYDLSESDGF